MIAKYIRFSTDKQDERQQENTIDKWLEAKGLVADARFTDEGVSGGVSYKERHLFDLCNTLKPNDTIIISEMSRLTRGGIAELSNIIEEHFKPNKLRLIICNVGLDVDCSDLNPLVEMQMMMLATFAKIEKIQIQDRTKSGLEVRKKKIAEDGFFISKKGNVCRKLGNPNGFSENAWKASAEKKKRNAIKNPKNIFFKKYIASFEERNGKITKKSSQEVFQKIADELNSLGQTTVTGLEYTSVRVRALWNKMVERYKEE